MKHSEAPALALNQMLRLENAASGHTIRAMSTIATRKVKDLPQHGRKYVEEILGCALSEDQRISVIVDAFYPRKENPRKEGTHGARPNSGGAQAGRGLPRI